MRSEECGAGAEGENGKGKAFCQEAVWHVGYDFGIQTSVALSSSVTLRKLFTTIRVILHYWDSLTVLL